MRRKTINRALHCEQAGMVDVQRIDLSYFGSANGPYDGVLFDVFGKFGTQRFIENLL